MVDITIPNEFYFLRYCHLKYNCLDFTIELWNRIFGLDISILKSSFVSNGTSICLVDPGYKSIFNRIPKPTQNCICVFRVKGNSSESHIGTFINGRVLHFSNSGLLWQPLDIVLLSYHSVVFYEYSNNNQQ